MIPHRAHSSFAGCRFEISPTAARRRSALLASAAVLALTLAAAPAFATDAGTDGSAGSTFTAGGSFTTTVDTSGGDGGRGATGAYLTSGDPDGGTGGNGGDGVVVNTTDTLNLTIDSGITLSGGAGGEGGDAGYDFTNGVAGVGGDGGVGGNGIDVLGSQSVVNLTNNGTIQGGDAGLGGSGYGSAKDGRDGTGGVGILANGTVTITNNGTISGGYDTDGTTVTGHAINVESGTTTLDSATDSTITGYLYIAEDATLVLGQTANDVTYDNTITGSGALEIDSDGYTVTLSGFNTFTGGVTLTSGTMAITTAAALYDKSSALTLSGGTLELGNGTDWLGVALTWSGTVNVTEETSSTIALSYDEDGYTSTFTVTNAITGTGSLTLTGHGSVNINGGTDSTLEALTLEDGVYVTLADGTSTTAKTVSLSGTSSEYDTELSLGVGATLSAADGVTIGAYSAIASYGNATIDGSVTVESGGTLAVIFQYLGVASSDHTLTISDDLTLESGSTLEVFVVGTTDQATSEIDWAASSIEVSGSATLSGTLETVVLLDSGALSESDLEEGETLTFDILEATDGYTGTFDDITSDYAFLNVSLDYSSSTTVALNVTRNSTSFSDVAGTKNQKSVASALESGDHDNDVYAAILTLDENGARKAYNKVSGEQAASTQGGIAQNASIVGATVGARVNQAFDASGSSVPGMQIATHGAAAATAIDYTAWTRAYGSVGSVDATANTASMDSSAVGVMIGADAAMGDVRLGVFAGYQHGEFDADDIGSSASDDAYQLGAYAGTQLGGLRLSGGAAYTWHDLETTRNIAFGGLAEHITGDTDAGSAQVFGEIGYVFDLAVKQVPVELMPFAGIEYIHLDTDGYTETGGSSALSIDDATSDLTYTTLGLRAATTVAIGANPVRLSAMAGWRHAFGDTTPVTTNRFAGGSAFQVDGAPIDEDVALVGAGVGFNITDKTSISLDYSGQFSDRAMQNEGSARFSLKF